MLIRLDIENFALIGRASFEPGKGFVAITGETGAGKSLLIDALCAIKGDRVGRDIVRQGAAKASVEAVVDNRLGIVDDAMLDSFGLHPDEDDLIYLSRDIFTDSRSVARVNGKNVPISVLRNIGSRFVDIHGQNEHQAIFSVATHLSLLDQYAGASLGEAMATYLESLARYKVMLEEMRELGLNPQMREKQVELLQYQVQEIENADLRAGEEDKLLAARRRADSYERLCEAVSLARDTLSLDEQGSALLALHAAREKLEAVAPIDDEINRLSEEFYDAILRLESFRDGLQHYWDRLDMPDLSPDALDARLETIYKLKSKYGKTLADILEHLEKSRLELNRFIGAEKRMNELSAQRLELEKELLEKADCLHHIRCQAAQRLSADICRELADLGMTNARFDVTFSKRPKERFFSKTGYDDLAFMMSANRGEDMKPLAKVASGGEAARIMLAIKTILADADQTPILVFDEVDTGISGKAAYVVGQKMRHLAQTHQVFCVTHMAQIAAMSDQHYAIYKQVENNRTVTHVTPLIGDKRITEVARLLSGSDQDAGACDLASRMIEDRIFIEMP